MEMYKLILSHICSLDNFESLKESSGGCQEIFHKMTNISLESQELIYEKASGYTKMRYLATLAIIEYINTMQELDITDYPEGFDKYLLYNCLVYSLQKRFDVQFSWKRWMKSVDKAEVLK